jgi:hypothetical protein
VRSALKTAVVALLLLSAFVPWPAAADSTTNVVVCFSATNATPLNTGFAGFTTELLGTGVEYNDTNMQRYAAMLSPGWLLFPAGTTGDAFNWQTGLTDTNWVSTIGARTPANNNTSNLCAVTVLALEGKGGARFTNFAAMAQNLGGSKIIVCVNGFTDTNPADAGAFAAFALTNHIPVAAWELCNEPYLFTGGSNPFFTNGADYASKMLPYRNAIKAADSNAVVAVFFSDPSRSSMVWNKSLADYGRTNSQYWDAVVYHYYPLLPTTNVSFANLMAMDNGILYSNSTLYVSNVLVTNSTPGTKFLLTEFNPCLGDGNGGQNPPTSTLYGGVYASEMVMRLSTVPQMEFAGSYQLVDDSGVATTNEFWNTVDHAATNNLITNTVGLPFGYFLSAQGSAEAVAYSALNRSSAVYATSVGTNCPLVPMDTNGVGFMPAIYAQAYQGDNGKRFVLLTNKSTNSVPVQITQDGVALTNLFSETYVTGSDPGIVNSNPAVNNVVIQTATVTNSVMIPEYSVVRLEWTVFAVPPPSLTITVSNATQDLQWTGLTNVIYNVQSLANFMGTWTTVGRVANTQNKFSFTNWNSAPQQLYRLTVP